jgi:23S rRNA (adenine-N6)-dimethyltransferase
VAGRSSRRRRLNQNLLTDRRLAAELAGVTSPGDLVVELGAGSGALTIPIARRARKVIAVEINSRMAERLTARAAAEGLLDHIEIVVADLLDVRLPSEPYRVAANPPFASTTAMLRRLLDDPDRGPERADLIVQWGVACKRTSSPPTSVQSLTWAPWWLFDIQRRIPRRSFRPMPSVDAAWLTITKRTPPVLAPEMAPGFAHFARSWWAEKYGSGGPRGRSEPCS